MLRQDHELVVNEKKVYRFCKELDILRPQRNLRRQHPRNLSQNRTITAPNQRYIAGEIRSDNEPQCVSHLFESECERWNVLHERIPPKTPNMNAYIESYHRLLEDECLSMGEFGTYAEAYQAVVEFVSRYNNRRLHSSLHYLSPAKFTVVISRQDCSPDIP